ncbi:MAG: hypothetical protein LBV09_03895 [Deferribacteraceae bacterium]|nr:hypothetical protein [Deferribacteraceae bacterium]
MEALLFSVIIALLMVHGMDAVRAKEWKMFLILKDMQEERGYKLFTILHFIIYIVIFYAILRESYAIKVIIDVFLLFHALLHYSFRRHLHGNGFKTLFSKGIIYSMALLAAVHLGVILQ